MGDSKNLRVLRWRSDADLRRAVTVARSRGRTWDDIGSVLQLTGREAARRYGRRLPGRSSSRRWIATVLMREHIE